MKTPWLTHLFLLSQIYQNIPPLPRERIPLQNAINSVGNVVRRCVVNECVWRVRHARILKYRRPSMRHWTPFLSGKELNMRLSQRNEVSGDLSSLRLDADAEDRSTQSFWIVTLIELNDVVDGKITGLMFLEVASKWLEGLATKNELISNLNNCTGFSFFTSSISIDWLIRAKNPQIEKNSFRESFRLSYPVEQMCAGSKILFFISFIVGTDSLLRRFFALKSLVGTIDTGCEE